MGPSVEFQDRLNTFSVKFVRNLSEEVVADVKSFKFLSTEFAGMQFENIQVSLKETIPVEKFNVSQLQTKFQFIYRLIHID